ncbi:MAG TPA: hypothetical protein VK524_19090 [Polyangiaceae bacterium]|nr:hypothetical protein [Polyangiaceae bacterium]
MAGEHENHAQKRAPDAGSRLRAAEPLAYALFAGLCTLYVGCKFYSSLRLQTLYAAVWQGTRDFAAPALGEWSAPLDDVFIHFDFARSFARGYPFQWSEGNGYSSGGTSLLYPIVLALGYWLGARRDSLMVWAAVIAFVCVFALLLASRGLFTRLPRWCSYLAPPALLCTGVLNWSLFSGMEVALFLAIWGATFLAWLALIGETEEKLASPAVVRTRVLVFGLCGGLLVATRPESITCLGVMVAGALLTLRRHLRFANLALFAAVAFAPGVLVMLGHALANYWFTGDSTAAGARVKLELHHPYLTREQVIDAWWFHFKYQILRVSEYHLAAGYHTGWIPWIFAVVALVSKRTRGFAALLWASSAAWMAIVALNGQVRWQNERYTMPALAWMLLAAALGVSVALEYVAARRPTVPRALTAVGCAALLALFIANQRQRFREQVWFFGRAARNILDQHVRTGRILRHFQRLPERVLVGDAGAIPYASDLPALDIIGLGGYHKLPFARATQLGVAAGIELIERIPPQDRPDVLAIYPSWWGNFPLWFGERIEGGEVPVRGNVICGGPSKVVYRANWQSLTDSARVFSQLPAERLVDSLDLADLISETTHDYRIAESARGHVDMKLLPHPSEARRDLWDAGRILPGGARESFVLSGFRASRSVRLVLRVAPAIPSALAVRVNGKPIGTLELTRSDNWQEVSLRVPSSVVSERLEIELHTLRAERILYHVWALEQR